MGLVWRDRPEWEAVVGRAEAALGEPLGRLLVDADADELLRTRNAQLAVLLTSLLAWEAVSDRVRAGRLRRPLPRSGDRADRGGGPALRRRRAVRGRAGRPDPGRGRRPPRGHGGPPRCDARAGGRRDRRPASSAGSRTTTPRARWCSPGTPDGLEAGVAAAKAAGARTAKPLAVGARSTPRSCSRPPTRSCDDLASVRARRRRRLRWSPTTTASRIRTPKGGGPAAPRTSRSRSAGERCRSTLVALGADRLLEVGHGTMLAALAKRAIPGTPVLGIADPDAADARDGRRVTDGRVALVTGASRGIGRATAIALAQAGMRVAVGYAERRGRGRARPSTRSAAAGGRSAPVAIRVEDVDAVDAAFGAVESDVRTGRGPGEQRRRHRRRAGHAHDRRCVGRACSPSTSRARSTPSGGRRRR